MNVMVTVVTNLFFGQELGADGAMSLEYGRCDASMGIQLTNYLMTLLFISIIFHYLSALTGVRAL